MDAVGQRFTGSTLQPVVLHEYLSPAFSEMEVSRIPPAAILASMERDQAVIDRWSGAAPFWEKHREIIRQMFAPVTQALVEDALIGSGHTVLDVATGPGEPALGIAGVVGAEGKIIGVDPIPEMVAAASRSAAQ